MGKKIILTIVILAGLLGASLVYAPAQAQPLADSIVPPASPVRLVFIHHSTGGNWLAETGEHDQAGGLGRALMENNYYVSATNYGWGPDAIGDRTDIINWPEWFTGPSSAAYMDALYGESEQNFGGFGSWPRLASDPGGENQIIVFKSCFPNSDLYGSPGDPPDGQISDQFTVGNAKAIYNDLLTYFVTRPDKLFIVITAPPLMEADTAPERAANARAFNNWLVNDWLDGYSLPNVAVFDFYNVLTSNGGDPYTSDAGQAGGNHHRWWNGALQHVSGLNNNFSAYPSGDSHPSAAGGQKASAEFVPLLNLYYNRWQTGQPPAPRVHTFLPLVVRE